MRDDPLREVSMAGDSVNIEHLLENAGALFGGGLSLGQTDHVVDACAGHSQFVEITITLEVNDLVLLGRPCFRLGFVLSRSHGNQRPSRLYE